MMGQEDVLLLLVRSREGGRFASGNGWTRGTNPCIWKGVSCDDNGDVLGLSLTGYSLDTTLPSEISVLSNIQNLVLVNCGLRGSIPPVLAQMNSLRQVDLSLNQLSGALPEFTSAQLAFFSVAHNNLSGTVPNYGAIQRPSLASIILSDNDLTGTLPSFSDSLPSLKHIDFSHNQLEGRLDLLETKRIHGLERLYISDNRFSGTLPPIIAEHLREFDASNNQLTGEIPETMSMMKFLQVFLIDNNRILGEVPPDVCDMKLNLNENYFSRRLSVRESDNNSRRRWTVEFMLENADGCSYVACPSGFSSNNGRHPCLSCEDQAMNPYLGATRCNNFSQDDVLDIFFQSTNGDEWGDESWANGSVEGCQKTGVECDADGNIFSLTLKDQGLSGTIPLELGFLPKLAKLDLSHNSLHGHLPEELSFPPLQELILSENFLTGYVPDALCRKKGINGNGRNGDFDCDIIVCAMGTHHPRGHATPGNQCQPCPMVDGLVLANTDCGRVSYIRSGDSGGTVMPSKWSQIVMVSGVGVILISLGYMLMKKFEGNRNPKSRPCSESRTSIKNKDQGGSVDSSTGTRELL